MRSIGIILRRWGHGPSVYFLRRHPGPSSETKDARASGVGGGGFNDSLGALARSGGVVFPVHLGLLVPGLGSRDYLGSRGQLANIPLFVRPSTGYQPKACRWLVQAKRAEAAADVKPGWLPGSALLR